MKELISGASTPSNVCVYTANGYTLYSKASPLLIDRLGQPGEGNGNRLILATPLDGADGPPLPPQLPPEGLPLFDWPARPFPTNTATGGSALKGGGNDAVRH